MGMRSLRRVPPILRAAELDRVRNQIRDTYVTLVHLLLRPLSD